MSRVPGKPSFDPSSTTPRELAAEIRRIGSNLAQLAAQPERSSEALDRRPANVHSKYNLPIETVRDMIDARRLRTQFFDARLFGEPAWDMLLELFHAEIAKRSVSLTSLSGAVCIPSATALRWIKVMIEADLVRYPTKPSDARCEHVELSPMASKAMHKYFNSLGRPQSASSDPDGKSMDSLDPGAS